jgi:membrane protease YdiL (CAAX protease family)
MPCLTPSFSTPGNFPQRHPVASYFALTFAISWLGALAVALPTVLRHQPISKTTGILMFPAMLLGPSLAGLLLTRAVDGRFGVRKLLSRISLRHVSRRWYAALFLPPLLVVGVLLFLRRVVSPAFAPNFFTLGIVFGIPAGFLEEIGWTGYAFPKMRSTDNAFTPAVLLGLLWSVWHLPVVDHLGAAAPHGAYALPFFLAFGLAMTAMRVLIVWLYANTKSIFLAQLMHMSSTGALVVFGAPHPSAAQETMWYALYGLILWFVVALVAKSFGKRLAQEL